MTQTLPWIDLPRPRKEERRILARSGAGSDAPAGAQGGSGWIPQVENPGHAEISQTSSAGDVDFVSWFLFILEGGVGGICRKIGRCGSRRGGTTDFHHVFRERDRNRRWRNEPPIASNGALDRIKPPMPLRIRRKTGRAAEARTSKKKARRNDQLRKRDPPFTPGVRAC